ncbi:hypothetical protein M5689_012891 [Euphorbia peplus]|nr:hypothetical protein M5689_012891 [Euphorbia peplus]
MSNLSSSSSSLDRTQPVLRDSDVRSSSIEEEFDDTVGSSGAVSSSSHCTPHGSPRQVAHISCRSVPKRKKGRRRADPLDT